MAAVSRTSRITAALRRVLWVAVVGVLGFVAGLFTVFVIVVRGGPPHELWHEVELEEEFTAGLADTVRTLDDYLALEERLFAELEREVYELVGTGPEFAFVRYSRGSRSDPRSDSVDWNRTFEMVPDRPIGGALLLHGLSDSPYSMRALGEELCAQGYYCVGLRLPGHGTAPAALKDTTVADLVAAMRIGIEGVAARVGDLPIHLVGYSTGASLAIRHCLDVLDGSGGRMPRSLVLLSPAVGLTPAAAFAGWLQLLAELPGLERAAWTDLLPEYDPYKYGSFTVNAGRLVYELTASNAARVAASSAGDRLAGFPPTIAFLSTVDATVSAEAAVDNLFARLRHGRHEIVLFDHNRAEQASSLLVHDAGTLTARMLADEHLPFAVTLITNRGIDTMDVVARRKPARTGAVTTEVLAQAWPDDVVSLSHVALPFRPDDPIYGVARPADSRLVFLGSSSLHGERGLLRIPADAWLRLRHNPFFDVVVERAIAWIEAAESR